MNENMPVDWASQMAAMANAEARQEQPEVGVFSFKSGILSFAGNPIPGGKVDLVVLACEYENRYFPEEFDADNIQSPLCWAFSVDGMNMAPPKDLVTVPQSDVCATCQWFQWDSDPKGRGGKACKSVRRFIGIPSTELDNIPKAHLGLGTISTTNAKYWSSYANSVAARTQLPTWAVITTLTCQPDQRTMVKLGFDLATPINEEFFPALMEKREKAIEILRKPYDKREEGWDKPKEPARKRRF